MKKYGKPFIAIVVLLATLGMFSWYIHGHPEVLKQLRRVPITTLFILLALYAVWWIALAVTLQISLHLYHKKMPMSENIMLSAYSSLLNFFGPGQSGPGLRAIYLKKKHDLDIKKYIFATLLYYMFYAVISAGLLFAGSQAWWKTLLGIILAGAGSALVLKRYVDKSQGSTKANINVGVLGALALATAIQLAAQCAIYFVEVHAVDHSVSVGQILTYTGAANFALFVALTPGAIGIRESFLLFTQHLHHLGSAIIVSANVIDRAAYLVLLGILFVIVSSMHAGKKLRLRQFAREAKND